MEANAEAVEAAMLTGLLAEMFELLGGTGEVTALFVVPPLFDGADGVRIELTLKSDEGLGDVNTVVDVVDALVDEVSEPMVVDKPALDPMQVGGGVFGGVVGDVEPSRVDDETTVSSMSTGLCSWSRIIFSTKLYFGFSFSS